MLMMPPTPKSALVLTAIVSAIVLMNSAASAQQVLCPPNAPLVNGQCNDSAGFSGAALASQALSNLSQAATQDTSDRAMDKLHERREQETSSDSNPPPPTAATTPAPAPVVVASRSAAGSKSKVLARRNGVEEARHERRERAHHVREERHEEEVEVPHGRRHATTTELAPTAPETSLRRIHGAAPPAAPIVTAAPAPLPQSPGVLFGTPVPIQPDGRYGSWIQGYGDYERRSANGLAGVSLGSIPGGFAQPVSISAVSKTTSFGFQVGADVTTRGLFAPGDGLIVGALGGFSEADLQLQTAALTTDPSNVGNGQSRMNASFTGGNFGLYATYFRGPFSADFVIKTDLSSLSENFTDFVAFSKSTCITFFEAAAACNPVTRPPFTLPYSNSGSASVVDVNLVGDLNYRFQLQPGLWVEPTVGAQYVTTMYGAGGAALGLADGEQVRLQGGARFGANFLLGAIPTTLTITGLAYDDVLVSGGFIKYEAFGGDNLLARADEGQVRGRGVVAMNFNLGGGFSSFIQADARGGYGLFGVGGKAGLRYAW